MLGIVISKDYPDVRQVTRWGPAPEAKVVIKCSGQSLSQPWQAGVGRGGPTVDDSGQFWHPGCQATIKQMGAVVAGVVYLLLGWGR